MSGNIYGPGLAELNVKEMAISAVVHRADGRVEDLGVISYYHRNPLRRVLWKLRRFLKDTARHG